ncbi:MAG: sugar porter family MFS transporter [Woeseiaceae bacterium]|nr:sugar porter family MFS transporter [Woeseiaceae bacterium]
MNSANRFTVTVAIIVALGGFLMGFDASVISGVVGFIETEFELTRLQLGWSVASLTLTATLAMMVAGPISDRVGRRPVLMVAAALFAVSAVYSALAPDFTSLVVARMIGGFGVGAALIIAPMYIAEIAPPAMRGRLVSFNQLNIVLGISVAFFSNYLILKLGQTGADWAESLRLGEWAWRWMLGVESIPAVLYFFALFFVPESPRWLAMHGRRDEARTVFERAGDDESAAANLAAVEQSIGESGDAEKVALRELFAPAMHLVMTIGVSIAVLQQITGINSVFFYAPMIFEQSGVGTDASFMQAVLVGIVNLVFTVAAMLLIDKLGRRPLLGIGLAGIATCMFVLSYGFGSASYTLHADADLPAGIESASLQDVYDVEYGSDVEFREAMIAAIGEQAFQNNESELITLAVDLNASLILFGILGFVASFAFSLGPVMWVLFSELFPNRLRGLAISVAGLINSGVSFGVQLVFPWELENFGNALTFLIYGAFALIGLVIMLRILPETRGRSLEELEETLVRR